MAEQTFKLPLLNIQQIFDIELAGRSLTIETKWNEECPAWELNIFDGVTAAPLILSLPIVTGVDLLSQFSHIGIDGSIIAYTDGDDYAPPTLDNLGIDSNVFYLVDIP